VVFSLVVCEDSLWHRGDASNASPDQCSSLSIFFLETSLLSNRFICSAVAFFVVGVVLGMYMGINQDFRLTHVHAHVNLLGWVSLAIAGLIYRVDPHLQHHWLAQAHFWLHNIGLIIFMGGFAYGTIVGTKALVPVAIGASTVSLGVLFFAINVFARMRTSHAA
jgi:uncharacterized membrane protein YoaT (DUF817 family)